VADIVAGCEAMARRYVIVVVAGVRVENSVNMFEVEINDLHIDTARVQEPGGAEPHRH
jgi:hypothetical protein